MSDISHLMIKVKELTVDEYLEGKSIHLLDVSSILSEEAYKLMLMQVEHEELCKLHRTLVMTESYENLKSVTAEINRRGVEIEIKEKSILYKPTTKDQTPQR